MTSIRSVVFCAAVAVVVIPGRLEAQVGKVFEEYCKAEDHSPWYCEDRKAPLADSQRWDILAAYCMDDEGKAASRRAADIAGAVSSHPKPPQGTAQVCEPFKKTPEPLSLRFNHRRGEWEDNGEVFKTNARILEFDRLTKVPTVHLKGGDHLGMVITDTNPLVFAANRGEAREDNIEAMKGLEKLLGALGGAMGLLAADVGPALTGKPSAAEQDVLDDREQIKKWALELKTPLVELTARLTKFVKQRGDIQLAAQMLEKGPAAFRGTLDESLENPAAWSMHFASLSKALAAVPNLQVCSAIFAAFPAITTADTPALVEAAAAEVLQLFDAPTPPCSRLTYPASVQATTTDVRNAARAAAAGGVAEQTAMRRRQLIAREEDLPPVLVLHRLMVQLSATQASAREVLLKEEETRKGAVSLGIVANRVRDAGFRRDGDAMLLVNRIYLPDELFDTSWTKIRITPLKLAVNSPYADQVPTTQPKEASTTYRLVRKGYDRLSVAAGVIYTKVANVVYTAVDPDPSSNVSRTEVTSTSENGVVTTVTAARPELKEIAEKERQSRSGSFAMFANYRLAELGWLGIGVQGGVGLSTDNPAFLGGLSVTAGKYLTLGAGCGAFRVKTLGIGAAGVQQQVGDKVATSDEIRSNYQWSAECFRGRRDAFYFALSLNLSGLAVFSPK